MTSKITMHLASSPFNHISLVYYLLFTVLTCSLHLTSASPIPYSDDKLAEIDHLRASGASEVVPRPAKSISSPNPNLSPRPHHHYDRKKHSAAPSERNHDLLISMTNDRPTSPTSTRSCTHSSTPIPHLTQRNSPPSFRPPLQHPPSSTSSTTPLRRLPLRHRPPRVSTTISGTWCSCGWASARLRLQVRPRPERFASCGSGEMKGMGMGWVMGMGMGMEGLSRGSGVGRGVDMGREKNSRFAEGWRGG